MRLPCKCRSWTSNLPSLALWAARHRNPDLTWGAAARAVLFASVAAACLRAMVFSLSSSYRVFSVRSLPSPLHTLVAVGGTYPPIKQTLNLLSDLKGKQRRRSPQPARARAGNSSFSKIFDGRHGPGGDGGASSTISQWEPAYRIGWLRGVRGVVAEPVLRSKTPLALLMKPLNVCHS